jgi:hypothetical protein
MKNVICFITLICLFILNSCGVSQQDYAKLQTERDELLKELDLYKNGEPRLTALIEQNIENGDFSSARENLTVLNNYHPESIGKPEISRLVTIIENEESRIARLKAEKEEAERSARLERQRGFENIQAADANVITVAEADLMESNKTLAIGGYYIIRGYFDRESGGRVRIGELRKRYSDGTYDVSGASIYVNTDRLLNLTEGTSVSILVRAFDGYLVINPDSKVQGFKLIEWQRQ